METKTKIAAGEQHLYYGGKLLVDGRTLANYNIQKGSTLLLTTKIKGTPAGEKLTEENMSGSTIGAPVTISEKTLNSGTYYLCNNVKLTQALVIQGDVTLDLNGFVLKITGSGSVIKIESGTLTLVDSHPAAIHKFVKNTDDLWMLDESQGAGIVRGGIITGGNAGYNDGGGVYVADKNEAKTLGRFTMKGGSIVGCVATDDSAGGGGVANHGEFTMTGGTIHRCSTTKGSGGGICSVRQLHISGSAVIKDCTAGGSYASSGAMLISPDSTYTAVIAGGTFDGNVENSKGTITGGTFNGQVRNSGVIENGQFNGAVNNYEGTIKGGTFNENVQNKNSIISGGTFLGGVRGAWTVTFDTDGGSTAPDKQVRANSKVNKPDDPTKEGYTFEGWYDGDKKFDFDTPVSGERTVTLKAKWTKEAAKYYYYSPADGSADAAKGSPKTFDPGVGIYAVSAALSLTGTAWIGRKRH